MRLWSIHPQYLDSKGLVALWREGLLAKKVLEGKTKGYKNHPQLDRFKKSTDPLKSINAYLEEVVLEADRRGYSFDITKIVRGKKGTRLSVTNKQIQYEIEHLIQKLKVRDPERIRVIELDAIKAHPLFEIVEGEVEEWERK